MKRGFMNKFLVFTDLDGTLLDHDDYSWEKATAAISKLESTSCPLIINSSKTSAEIILIRKQMNIFTPFVSENGAVANIPKHYFNNELNISSPQHSLDVHHFGKSYVEIITILNELRDKYKFSFRGFNDMSVDEIMIETRLNRAQALDAKKRQGSEPLIWMDSNEKLERFKSLLKVKALIMTSGGRFYHVMSPVSKGQAVTWLTKQYMKSQTRTQWKTVGLGDSYNDVPMLEAVDYPILIRNPASKQPDVSHINNLHKVELAGPAGWNQAILEILDMVT